MITFKNAPTPWKAVFNGFYWHVEDAKGITAGDSCGASSDAYDSDVKHLEDGEGVARLFAAAPELLEACKQLVYWHARRSDDDTVLHPDAQEPEIKAAMAAIAKAEAVSVTKREAPALLAGE